jgi:hypothetical protein
MLSSNYLTNFKQQSPWEANTVAVSKNIANILWKQEICYSAQKIPPPNACPEPDTMFLSTPRSAKCYFFIISSVTDFKEDRKKCILKFLNFHLSPQKLRVEKSRNMQLGEEGVARSTRGKEE